MGKRSSQRKSAALFDSDDDSLSTSSTCASDAPLPKDNEDVDPGGHSLELYLDALYEKRGSTREKALLGLVDAFASYLQIRFAENNYITLQHQLINSIKRGSLKEASLASRALGLLAITVGSGDNAHEILEESTPHLSQALKSGTDSLKRSSVLDCLAIVTFVGGKEYEETLKSMELMWQLIHPKSGSNVAAPKKSSPAVSAAAISAWSFLLSSTGEWKVNSNIWQEAISLLSNLLDKDDRSIRIAAGEAIALIFEIGTIDKISKEAKNSTDNFETEGSNVRGFSSVEGLKVKILNQVRNLSVEAGGKGSGKKDLNSQRNLFRDVLAFIENAECPETSVKLQQGAGVLVTSTWAQLIQLNFLKRFLGSGFLKHMEENELLHEIFEFTPKKKIPSGNSEFSSGKEKRLFKLQNSAACKARTQLLNKHRMMAQDRNTGHFGAAVADEEF
eukprot:TRINITY_DN2873_c0_g1_i1.p1 TRINITY_DN2873_c0_g1~~TRINITY_DN2873_c0_g1_i1.p1  ORF type:complete len:447 (+),score=103.55 TRINITY_DN2873_c0_g1_i1:424-1764(+)